MLILCDLWRFILRHPESGESGCNRCALFELVTIDERDRQKRALTVGTRGKTQKYIKDDRGQAENREKNAGMVFRVSE